MFCNRATTRFFTSNPRWSLPTAIFMLPTHKQRRLSLRLHGGGRADELRQQHAEVVPDLFRTGAIDRVILTDRIRHILAFRTEQGRFAPKIEILSTQQDPMGF